MLSGLDSDGRRRREPSPVDVSIVIPCLNEAETLAPCIDAAAAALAELARKHGLAGEIVVADNGSTDASVEIAERRAARVARIGERGYGNALRGGIAATRGRFIVMGDADCSYDFREAVPMVERLLQGCELCMGSRFRGEIKPGAMPWKNRYIGNPVLTGTLNLFFRSGLTDAHCGLRAFTRAAFDRLGLTSEGMEFASEMVLKAALLDMKRAEVPVTLHPDRRSRPPHLRPWRDGWRHLRYLLMLSPAWLFFVPSGLFLCFGALVFAALLTSPPEAVVHIGGLWFGDHWMILSGALIAIAHQTALFGMAAVLYGTLAGYRRPGLLAGALLRLTRLEYMLLSGFLVLAAGLGLLAAVFISWSSDGFGPLSATREMVLVATLVLLGLQNMFGGFLLSVVRGNRTRATLAR